MKTLIRNHKIAARKAVAKLNKMLTGSRGEERKTLLNRLAAEKEFLEHDFSKIENSKSLEDLLNRTRYKFSEMMPGLPGAPEEYVYPDSMPKFGRLMMVLEQEEYAERQSLEMDRNPSDTDIERWALKAAVLEYYKSLSVDPEKIVTDVYGDDQTIRELAPNQEKIYQIWLRRLEEQSRAEDKHKLKMDKYDEAVNRGFGRGTAFEKQLDRYREEFMHKLWQKHNEEVRDARQHNS